MDLFATDLFTPTSLPELGKFSHFTADPQGFRQGTEPCELVLCYVFQSNEHESKPSKSNVALPRRDAVTAQCHRLAPILGIIQGSSPIKAAWRTVQEQTKLSPTSLSVFRHGKPFLLEDSSIPQKCLFHSFAFHVTLDNNEDDMEAQKKNRWKWYDPKSSEWEECRNVSYLWEGLRTVWFEIDLGPIAGRILAGGLRQLQNDHESGARKMAGISLSVLQSVLENIEDPITLHGPWWNKACIATWHLWKNGRPSMDAAILSFLLMTLGEIETYLSTTSPQGAAKSLRKAFDAVQKTMRSFTSRISHNLASYTRSRIGKSRPLKSYRVLTLSASSTIRECIIQAALAFGAESIEVRVLESRPLFEGVSMAASILESLKSRPNMPKVRVTIFTDASVAMAAKDVDLFLLAADRIAADGSVSNKTGSLPAALSVRHMSPSADIIVVSEIHKVAMQSCDTEAHIAENNEPSEVIEAWEQAQIPNGLNILQDNLGGEQPTVDIQNVYFEWVPPSLIDAYICEDGRKAPVDFEERSQWVKRRCDEYFESSLRL